MHMHVGEDGVRRDDTPFWVEAGDVLKPVGSCAHHKPGTARWKEMTRGQLRSTFVSASYCTLWLKQQPSDCRVARRSAELADWLPFTCPVSGRSWWWNRATGDSRWQA